MYLNNMPTEVLSLILSQLPYVIDNYWDESPIDYLRNARLVCRRWNTLCSPILFRITTLQHFEDDYKADDDAEDEDKPLDPTKFSLWHAAVDSEVVKQHAKVAKINSGPHKYMDERDWTLRELLIADRWKEFPHAISRLADLPNINEVFICFTDHVWGQQSVENDFGLVEDVERPLERLNTLRYVFKAMEQHKARQHGTKIRTLSIQHLANHIIPEEVIMSDSFQFWVKDITGLNLRVSEEYNEHGPDHDLDLIERRRFEPWLQNRFLPFFADQLTSLHLSFDDCWGTAPGIFDGGDLIFPNLKKVHLCQFAISHNDHLDWVMRQPRIEKLYLNRCYIVEGLRFYLDDMPRWGVKTHDWVVVVPEEEQDVDWDIVYQYNGTWEMFLGRMREKMLRLIDVRITHWDDDEIFVFDDPVPMQGGPTLRYKEFDIGTLPSRWLSPNAERVERAKEGDLRAWGELVEVTEERRGRMP
ncbi:hypothetical protein QBC38DRAFT_523972 [Podospora fimiseda]|uniref:F-box domain-containing protein n=1 Tax=Podospora fimiseda TaxID=252190 RepID=A0AAN6YN00_9PEZI|nr:hypothetical protein QBC38DRAFT_523972 [Podospora fimiseda]